MKHFLLITFISFELFSCSGKKEEEFKKIDKYEVPEITYDYSDVQDKIISWNQMSLIDIDRYFLYFYSTNCSHCNSLKNEIVKFALSNDNVFLVKSSNLDKIINDVNYTIGRGIDGDFAIAGYPTLVEILNKNVEMNIAGENRIRNHIASYLN